MMTLTMMEDGNPYLTIGKTRIQLTNRDVASLEYVVRSYRRARHQPYEYDPEPPRLHDFTVEVRDDLGHRTDVAVQAEGPNAAVLNAADQIKSGNLEL